MHNIDGNQALKSLQRLTHTIGANLKRKNPKKCLAALALHTAQYTVQCTLLVSIQK
jgi:hypothetical protein